MKCNINMFFQFINNTFNISRLGTRERRKRQTIHCKLTENNYYLFVYFLEIKFRFRLVSDSGIEFVSDQKSCDFETSYSFIGSTENPIGSSPERPSALWRTPSLWILSLCNLFFLVSTQYYYFLMFIILPFSISMSCRFLLVDFSICFCFLWEELILTIIVIIICLFVCVCVWTCAFLIAYDHFIFLVNARIFLRIVKYSNKERSNSIYLCHDAAYFQSHMWVAVLIGLWSNLFQEKRKNLTLNVILWVHLGLGIGSIPAPTSIKWLRHLWKIGNGHRRCALEIRRGMEAFTCMSLTPVCWLKWR